MKKQIKLIYFYHLTSRYRTSCELKHFCVYITDIKLLTALFNILVNCVIEKDHIYMERSHIYGKITYIWKYHIYMERSHIYGKITYIWKDHIYMERSHIYGKITYIWKDHIYMERSFLQYISLDITSDTLVTKA